MQPPENDAADLAERLRHAIGEIVRAVRSEADTPRTARSETLGILDRDGGMSVAALAERRKVKHQSMRLVVAQLETEDLVTRHSDSADRRSQVVTLTDAGRTALEHGRSARATTLAVLINERLSEADRAVLRSALPVLERLVTPGG